MRFVTVWPTVFEVFTETDFEHLSATVRCMSGTVQSFFSFRLTHQKKFDMHPFIGILI